MADNKVEILVTGRDEAGPAFASAAAQEKAFARAVDQSNTTQVKGYQAAAAAASSHLRAVKLLDQVAQHEADDAAKAAETHSRLGKVFSDLTNKITGGNGLIGAFRNLDMVGLQAFQSLGNAGSTFINPITIALAGLAAILSGPLIASLVPITLGFGTFGAVAVTEIKKVIAAQQALQAAQQQYEKATTASARATALKNEKLATEDLNATEKAILPVLSQLGAMWAKLQKAVQPEVIKAFGSALKIIKDLFPALTPLAVAAGKAVDGFLKNIDSWLKSGSGQKFLKWLETDGPHAIARFTADLWTGAQFIGRVFSFLNNAGTTWFRNVSNGLNTIHKDWSATINFFVGVGHDFESVWNSIESAFESGYSVIAGIASQIEGVISGIAAAFGSLPGMGGGRIPTSFGNIPNPSGNIGSRAGGGIAGGLTWVGEHGPELLRIPGGSRVYSSNQSRQMLATAGGGGNTYNISVAVAPGGHPAETGRQIVNLIKEFERGSGKSWRAA